MDKKIEVIWDEFHKKLFKYINSKINNEHDTEDILQEVFVKIYNNINEIEDEAKIKSWIYKITKNSIIDYYKKKKAINMDIEDFDKIINEDEDEDESNMNEDITKCFEMLIGKLPAKYNEPLYLHDIEGKKYKEISKELDISLSCSKMRVTRARSLLKETLLKCCDFEVDSFGNIVEYKVKNKGCKDCKDCKGGC